ncbi:MAG: hypothetical protein AAGF31_00335 [Planctomycetota bacterium]
MLASMTTAFVALALTASAPQAPQWEADYGKALAQTRSDDRPLLIVLDNPGAEEQQLGSEVLGEDHELLAAYDLCRVNVETEYGKKVADVFGAKSFPYVAIIDKTGSVILHSQAGDISADAWKTTLSKFKTGERAVRVTVAKPVTVESGAYLESTPVYSTPVNGSSSYYAPPADCPNCRRGY